MKVQQIYDKIPRQVFFSLYIFSVSLMFLAWAFTGLQIEEWILGCTGHTTGLQSLGLDMNFNGFCNDEEFIKDSIIWIVASGLYGYVMAYSAYLMIEQYRRRKA